MNTIHYTNDRIDRENLIKNVIGQGKVIKGFIVDRGHKNGKEAHMITDTAIILVYNYNSKKLVTKLIARPNQLVRYFGKGNVPQKLWDLAYEHKRLGYNEI